MTAPCCRAEEGAGQEAAETAVERTLKDDIIRLTNIKASAKIRSVLGGGQRSERAAGLKPKPFVLFVLFWCNVWKRL